MSTTFRKVNGRHVPKEHESATRPKSVKGESVAKRLKEKQNQNRRLRMSGRETASVAPDNTENATKE